MPWDFETDPEYQEKLDWARAFVREEVEPLDLLFPHLAFTPPSARIRAIIDPLKQQVREAGLWATHLEPELGGQGHGQLKLSLLNEILGRSSWAPVIFGCQAPDTGNAEIIAKFGTPEQKERYLKPLLDGGPQPQEGPAARGAQGGTRGRERRRHRPSRRGTSGASPAVVAVGGPVRVDRLRLGHDPEDPAQPRAAQGCKVLGFQMRDLSAHEPAAVRRDEEELRGLLADGKAMPHVGAVFKLSEAAAALRHVAEGKAIGKVILTID